MAFSGKTPGMDDKMAFLGPSPLNFLTCRLANLILPAASAHLALENRFPTTHNVVELLCELTLALPSPSENRQKRIMRRVLSVISLLWTLAILHVRQ